MGNHSGEVSIPTGKETIKGNLEVPPGARAIVLFAHGSGSGRFSPRNTYVARLMNAQGMGTLLVDLLTSGEEEVDEQTAQYRFDVDLLARRLIDATMWLKQNSVTKNLVVGYFGASTGAAAALIAAAKLPDYVKAVVSRGGRPDLAADHLPEVKAPTLLIVGGNDFEVLEMNKDALKLIRVEKKLEIVAGATHLFEESGTLQKAASLAINWFAKHLYA
ncbi:MAG TPA: dienelactone hydrolase family protein [Candidatus Nanoarchaeia archaeon]|nr:dienelactone hydrolase family protein [Candidatus Nanoarchaeia archaeon]